MIETELAKWMQDEHDRVDELMHGLAELTVEPPPGRRDHWIREMRERFSHFRAHMIKHMAAEERGGYLAPVLERRPTLSHEVHRLRGEHNQMMRLLEFIHQALEIVTEEDGLIIRDCCRRVGDVLTYVEQHEERENLLVSSVFTRDIGSHD